MTGRTMLTCFILINVAAKKEDEVYNALVSIKEIEGIREVFGQYDVIARIEAKDVRHLRNIIMNHVRNIPGILATTTLITVE